jgi:hypothetical protein
MLADVAHEVDGAQRCKPVDVIAHQRRLRAVKVEEPFELRADPARVALDLVRREQLTLLTLAGWVTDEPCPATHQRDRPVSVPLQMNEPHHRDETSDVET